mmetsp:Transcript_99123/g.296212  ORF Transcript_99123/g.296212 Transcript_99123/m.296212 type:complete len:225 (-) Transcript_99123:297-971(-)
MASVYAQMALENFCSRKRVLPCSLSSSALLFTSCLSSCPRPTDLPSMSIHPESSFSQGMPSTLQGTPSTLAFLTWIATGVAVVEGSLRSTTLSCTTMYFVLGPVGLGAGAGGAAAAVGAAAGAAGAGAGAGGAFWEKAPARLGLCGAALGIGSTYLRAFVKASCSGWSAGSSLKPCSNDAMASPYLPEWKSAKPRRWCNLGHAGFSFKALSASAKALSKRRRCA